MRALAVELTARKLRAPHDPEPRHRLRVLRGDARQHTRELRRAVHVRACGQYDNVALLVELAGVRQPVLTAVVLACGARRGAARRGAGKGGGGCQ